MGTDYAYMGLRLMGWFRENQGKQDPVLYAVSGLSSEDSCIVGYAGRGDDGKKKWYLHWYRSGRELETPKVAYDSPEDALKAAAEFRAANNL